jgi:hypothetical protein
MWEALLGAVTPVTPAVHHPHAYAAPSEPRPRLHLQCSACGCLRGHQSNVSCADQKLQVVHSVKLDSRTIQSVDVYGNWIVQRSGNIAYMLAAGACASANTQLTARRAGTRTAIRRLAVLRPAPAAVRRPLARSPPGPPARLVEVTGVLLLGLLGPLLGLPRGRGGRRAARALLRRGRRLLPRQRLLGLRETSACSAASAAGCGSCGSARALPWRAPAHVPSSCSFPQTLQTACSLGTRLSNDALFLDKPST